MAASRYLATMGFDQDMIILSQGVCPRYDHQAKHLIRISQSRLRRGGGAAMSDWCSATSKAAIHLEREAIGRDWFRLVMIGQDWSRLVTIVKICQDATTFDWSRLVRISQD